MTYYSLPLEAMYFQLFIQTERVPSCVNAFNPKGITFYPLVGHFLETEQKKDEKRP